MRVGYEKIATFDQYLASSHVVNAATVRCYKHGTGGPWQVGGQSLLITGDGQQSVYDKQPHSYAKDNKHLIVRIGEAEAIVTNNRRVCSRYCTVKANYRQTRSIARPLCDSLASCKQPK